MSRPVRISTISAAHAPGSSPCTEQIIQHLQRILLPVLSDRSDLIVLPEVCDKPSDCGATAFIKFKKQDSEEIRRSLAQLARAHRTYIAYASLSQGRTGSWHNTVEFLDRNGNSAGIYNKVNLTEWEMNAGLVPGKDACLIQTDFGRIAPIICFDLNFPALRAQVAALKPDLIVFPSMFHGAQLQDLWAIECQAYFVASVPIQASSILSPVGQELAATTNYYAFVTKQINLDSAVVHLDWNQEKLAAMKQKYGPAITMTDPGRLGRVLLSCESAEMTIQDVIREFEICPLDEYFKRVMQARAKVLERNE